MKFTHKKNRFQHFGINQLIIFAPFCNTTLNIFKILNYVLVSYFYYKKIPNCHDLKFRLDVVSKHVKSGCGNPAKKYKISKYNKKRSIYGCAVSRLYVDSTTTTSCVTHSMLIGIETYNEVKL
jgi:hypothetical protein